MRVKNNGNVQQINGREGETATLLFSLCVSLALRVGGFAPRHLSRYVALSWLRRESENHTNSREIEVYQQSVAS